ncbi:MAG TPA: phenylalanine--tRNA ligase beta subunit-related protein [Thermoanaerobaculia bacterium]|nr:phenylalanine--tRNA ligase beta subunit-related protein [Thermoanaerobaculia bacterium]
MTALRVTSDIFDKFPAVVLGVVIAHGIDNSGEDADILKQLRAEEESVRRRLAGAQLSEHPRIAPWREAYRAFGAKPKDHPSSIENLVRRVLKGNAVPHINTLVDAYNTISLRWLVPVGGEDLAAVQGDVLLTIATADEKPALLLGEAEPRAPHPGEVLYKDDLGALCRRWNWKEADRTKLTATTRHAFLVIEGLPPVPRADIETATQDLAALVRTACGGEVTTALVDRARPEVELG